MHLSGAAALEVSEVIRVNDQNLIPGAHKLTVEEQSRGGKASGAARGFRSTIKKRLKEKPELIGEIFDTLIDMILNDRDLRALELLIELSGESPRQMEIALKKQELKIRKEAAENGNW